jgi:hypothetical protein
MADIDTPIAAEAAPTASGVTLVAGGRAVAGIG